MSHIKPSLQHIMPYAGILYTVMEPANISVCIWLMLLTATATYFPLTDESVYAPLQAG